MYGFMTPADGEPDTRPPFVLRVRAAASRYRWFLLIVILPTLIVGGYLYLFAADQYQSEAHYLVRAQGTSQPSSSGLGQLLGVGGGPGQNEAMSVADYLTSHDVLYALQKQLNLVEIFRRPEGDYFSIFPRDKSSPEDLLKFYRSQVSVNFDKDSGITDLTVRTFRPEDSHAIAKALLRLGEQRVNEMNARAYRDGVSLARRQLAEAETALNDVQTRMTTFRQSGRDVNPEGSADAQLKLVSELNAQLSQARSQIATTANLIGTRNPQYSALAQRIRALESQVAAQSGKLAGEGTAIAAGLGDYERLRLQQEFLAKRFDAASASFESARQQAVRQQLYVVRVVDANVPIKSEYPKRGIITLTLFVILIVVYGIAWLVAAGVREHAA